MKDQFAPVVLPPLSSNPTPSPNSDNKRTYKYLFKVLVKVMMTVENKAGNLIRYKFLNLEFFGSLLDSLSHIYRDRFPLFFILLS